MQFGRFEIYPLSDGFFRLDGGGMFGIVPRVIWEKLTPPDERNRILLALGVLLIRAQGMSILVDTGVGNKGDPTFCDIYGVDRTPSLETSLSHHRLTPDDIHIVINTHLHFDHAGGNTRKDAHGSLLPTFSKAKYYIQRKEWEFAMRPNERTKGGYLLENYAMLIETGHLQFLEGDARIVEGVSVMETPGHTEHHQSVIIESEGQKGIFLGDLIPTTSHIPYPYVMGYDLFPLTTIETKKKVLEQAYEEHWLLFFQHDPKVRMGYLKRVNKRFVVEEVKVS